MSIDLHVHTTYSDGTLTPYEVIQLAKTKSLQAIAITDHDTTDGLDESKSYCEQFNIEFIPGIELAGQYNNIEVHILGLLIDYHDSPLSKALQSIVKERNARNNTMINLFNDIGINITLQELSDNNPDCIITRSHFANILVAKGITNTREQAFRKYLSKGCPTYIERNYLTAQQCIQLIHDSNGIAILAHPTLYGYHYNQISTMLQDLKESGLDGVEGIYPTYTPPQTKQIYRLAEANNLLLSGGSDFHGTAKPNLDLGSGYGRLDVPYSILSNLKEYKNNI